MTEQDGFPVPDEPVMDVGYLSFPANVQAALEEGIQRGECDAHLFGHMASIDTRTGQCRCLVCARCGHHTGNAHQGHWWKACDVLAGRVRASLAPGEQLSTAEWLARTSRPDFHFCCPEPHGCEAETADWERTHD